MSLLLTLPSLLAPRFARRSSSQKELAHLGVKTVMEMLFMYDFVHGDLHPGNIMVCRNPASELSMNLLDCGICVEMGESDHKNLINILGGEVVVRVASREATPNGRRKHLLLYGSLHSPRC